ncbi:MAG: hypothetical protein HQM09_14895 [Candidatus Riflebacteria bacterium]|nr:hypothetical protein [Candidatus Riflebacteria bacterium]
MKKAAWALLVLCFVVLLSESVFATPSTQIWIPSTDIQPFGKTHFGYDTYIKGQKQPNGNLEPTVTNMGLTFGFFKDEKLRLELGMDYRDIGGDHQYPIYFNTKLGYAENALATNSPAIAIGAFDLGLKHGLTDYNVYYFLMAKTFGNTGRFSAGYYGGNKDLLLDAGGHRDNTGFLVSWDKNLSDKWWGAIDYQSGKNSYGALSFGVSYKFASNTSVIFGYDIWNESLYKPTFTVQLDIDF